MDPKESHRIKRSYVMFGYFCSEMSQMAQMGPKHPKCKIDKSAMVNFGLEWANFGLSPGMSDPILTMYGLIE